MLEKLFKNLSLSIIKTPYIYLIVIAILTIVAVYFAFPIKIDTDLMKMAPANDPYVTSYVDYLNNTGGNNFNILMIKTDKNLDKSKKFADDVIKELKLMPKYVKYIVSYKDRNLIDRYGLYYLSNKELKNINFRETESQSYLSYFSSTIQNQIRNFKNSIRIKNNTPKMGLIPTFNIPKSTDILQSMDAIFNSLRNLYVYIYTIPYLFGNVQPIIDSLKIYTVSNNIITTTKYLEDVKKIMDEFSTMRKNQFYEITPDKKYIVITMIMAKPSSDLNFVDKAMKKLGSTIRKIDKNYNLTYGFTGTYAAVKENKDAISYSLQSTTIFSLIGIIILFAIAYRRLSFIFTVILVLIISTTWLLAIVNLLIGHFNSITSFMIATLLGLGIDYSIHLTSGYIRERQNGGIAEEGIIVSLSEVGPSITIGALTTAAAFLILIVAPSQAFRELAIIASMGILAYWIVSIITIPTIFAIFRKAFKPRQKTRMDSTFLEPISNIIKKHNILIIIIFIFVSIAISYYSFDTINNFDYSNSELVTPGIKSEILFKDLLKSTGATNTTQIYVYASSLNEIDNIKKKVFNDKTLSKYVVSIQSIKNYLPVYDNTKRFYINKILSEFRYLEKNPIFLAFMDKWSDFRNMMNNCYAIKDYTQEELDEKIINDRKVLLPIKVNYLYGKRYVVQINVTSKIYGSQLEEFFNACENSDLRIISYPTALYSVMRSIKNSTWITLAASVIAISIIIFLSFKNLTYSLSTLSVLLIALWWMFGFMDIFNYKMNMITAIVMPLIIGIGVDNGVHMTSSFIVNGKSINSIGKSILGTGKALTFSMATTVLAFASGLFSNNPAFKEIGVTLSIGIVSSYLAGIFFVPAIYVTIEKAQLKSMTLKIKGEKK
jgi:hypothetical protein